jgi:hypothetical protein
MLRDRLTARLLSWHLDSDWNLVLDLVFSVSAKKLPESKHSERIVGIICLSVSGP